MTSSSTVGTGRRYRLTDHGRAALAALLERGTLDREGKVLVAEGAAVDLPDHWVEPVGLDMAEPDDDGTIVQLVHENGAVHAAIRRDKRVTQLHADRRWYNTAGFIYTWPDLIKDAVSITVLVPRDDDLRERLTAARDEAAEKANNLTGRNVVGVTHAFYRNVMTQLLDPSGFSINGRDQADSGE